MERDFDITKLSKKVQNHILLTEENLKYYKRKLDEALGNEGDSNTSVLGYDAQHSTYNLPNNARVRFYLTANQHEYIDCVIENKHRHGNKPAIYLNGSSGFTVFPEASNSCRIQTSHQ